MERKIKSMKKLLSVMMCIALLLSIPMKAEAKDELRLMQYFSTKETLQLYIGGETEIQGVIGQVARTPVEVVATETVTDIHTIILIDNSLSITEENQGKVASILEAYMSQKAPEEMVSLAIYGEDITYLIEKEKDGSKVLEAVAGITYQNQDSYLTDILYDELEKLNNKTEYTRFIVATDGVDNKAIGYTKDELTEYLKDENYPVYSLGCMYKNNTTELENLFAISRLTNANYYLVDDYEDYTEIVDGINEKIQRIIFEVPEEYRNGSEQNVLITMETEGPAVELSGKYSMPFDIEVVEEPVVEEIVEEPVIEETVEEEPVVEEVIIEEPMQEEAGIDFVTIGAIGIIVIALIVLLVMKLTKKKDKQPKNVSMNNMYQQPVPPMGQPMPPMGQPMSPMGQPMAAFAEEEGTVLLNSNRKTLNMRDRNSGKVFSYPISAEGVVVGRNRDGGAQIAINYSALISRKHCKISVVGSRNYIEDLGSANGTFVNGRSVQSKMEFNNGDIIKLGDIEMEVSVN